MGMVLHVIWKADTFCQVESQKMVFFGTNRIERSHRGDGVTRCQPMGVSMSATSGCLVSSSSTKHCVWLAEVCGLLLG
ncbi:hypothetical protein CsSME_00016866 [Camellia sinensis var. sinensis]